MAKEHIYKDCIIVEFSDASFLATTLDIDGDIIKKNCKNLDAAKRWIDKVEQTIIEETNRMNER